MALVPHVERQDGERRARADYLFGSASSAPMMMIARARQLCNSRVLSRVYFDEKITRGRAALLAVASAFVFI